MKQAEFNQDVRRRAFHRKVVWVLAVALVVAHHDFWWWDSRELVLGFLPITIAYHMLFSLAAGALWVYAIFFAWPRELEAWADEVEPQQAGRSQQREAEAVRVGQGSGGGDA